MDLLKLQEKIDDENYNFILKEDSFNDMKFVHISLAKKLGRFFTDEDLKYEWNDNTSAFTLLKINNDVYFDINIDTRLDKHTIKYSFIIEGVYIPINLPENVFNRIVNKFFNVAQVTKKTVGNSEYMYYWWD